MNEGVAKLLIKSRKMIPKPVAKKIKLKKSFD